MWTSNPAVAGLLGAAIGTALLIPYPSPGPADPEEQQDGQKDPG